MQKDTGVKLLQFPLTPAVQAEFIHWSTSQRELNLRVSNPQP